MAAASRGRRRISRLHLSRILDAEDPTISYVRGFARDHAPSPGAARLLIAGADRQAYMSCASREGVTTT